MINKLRKNRVGYLVALSILFSLVLPLIFKLIGLSSLMKIIILFVVYGIFSLFTGKYVRRYGLKQIDLFIFPIIYVVFVAFFSLINFGLFSYVYGIYFALYFVVLSFFAYQTNDNTTDKKIDEQIPVDGGIKNLEKNGKK